MTLFKVTWQGQRSLEVKLLVILVNLFQILFEQVRFNYNQTWIIGTLRCTMGTFTLWCFPRSHDKVKGHWRSNCYSYLTSNCYSYGCPRFFKLLLHEQVRSDYNQTWIIDALWEPSRYDALRGHMTRSKVIGGQIVIVMVALFQIAPAWTGSLRLQPNLNHRCTMGTFTLWRTSRSHDKVNLCHFRSTLNTKISTVKPVYSDHPRETKSVAFIDRWLLYIQVLKQIMCLHGNQFSGHYIAGCDISACPIARGK